MENQQVKENHRGAFNRPVKRKIIESLYEKGYLSAGARSAALHFIEPGRAWWPWANRLMLFLGSALILAGILFFFAFNWAAMSPLLKFVLIQAGLLGCIIGTWKTGPEKISGKILLIGASFMVGIFLAVFGQVYQTGADAFELFTGWALLIAGWVIISEFAALWVMWLTIIDTALILYWEQVMIRKSTEQSEQLFILLALINTIALVLSYYGRQKKIHWLSASWPHRLILSSVLFFLFIPSLDFILDARHTEVLSLTLMILFLAACYYVFRYRSPDPVSLTLCTLTLCVLLLTVIGHYIFEQSSAAPFFLLFGFIVLGVFSGATFWLKMTVKKIKGESPHV